MSRPDVSVVMPVRNGARFLEQALNSVQNQSLAALEIIVVDDGSSDDTPSILSACARSDARVRVISIDGKGVADALNIGIEMAAAPLVARMDADDMALPTRMERQFEAMNRHGSISVLGSAATCLDAKGAKVAEIRYPLDHDDIAALLPKGNCIVHPSVMVKKAAMEAVGGYRTAYAGCEDYDLWLRLAERHRLANLPEPLLLYRLHEEQSTYAKLEQRILAEIAALQGATRRRAGGPDFGNPVGGFDRQALLDAGIELADLSEFVADRALAAARGAIGIGQIPHARAALALARREPANGWRSAVRRLDVATRIGFSQVLRR